MKNKSQVGIIDLLIATSIILILLTLIMISWVTYTNKQTQNIAYDTMQIKAFQIADLLVNSPGSPSAWENYQNIIEINVTGLATQSKNLSETKVNSFKNLTDNSYDTTKSLLNIRSYEFYLELKTLSDLTLITIGLAPDSEKNSVTIKRNVLYKNDKAILEITLWK